MTRLRFLLPMFALLGLGVATTPIQAGAVDYFPADTVGFAHVRVAALWKSPAMARYRATLDKAGREAIEAVDAKFHPNPSTIDSMAVVMAGNPLMLAQSSPDPVIILTTTVAMDQKLVAQSMLGKHSWLKGSKVPTAVDAEETSVAYFPDETTVIVGSPKGVTAFMKGKRAIDGKMGAMLKAAQKTTFTIGFELSTIPEQAKQGFPESLRDILNIRTLLFEMDVDKAVEMKLSMIYPDADSAEAAETLIRQYIGLGTQYMAAAKPFLTQKLLGLDQDKKVSALESLPEAAAMLFALGGLNYAIEILNDPPLARKEGTLVMSVTVPPGELTGVFAISGLGVGLALPAVQKVREAAARMQSQNNLKQIGLAMHNYESANQFLPSAAIVDEAGKPLLSWRVAILPYIEQDALYRKFKLDEPWDSPNNKALIPLMPKIYLHPSVKNPEPGKTVYQIFTGNAAADKTQNWATIFPELKTKPRLVTIPDGTSNTIMVAEAKDGVIWTKPEDMALAPGKPFPKLGGHSTGGFNVLLGDGSVRFVVNTIPESSLRIMIGANDGMVNPND